MCSCDHRRDYEALLVFDVGRIMKLCRLSSLVLVVAAATTYAADRPPERLEPQPRVRLIQTPVGAVAQKQPVVTPGPPVMLQKVEVSEKKLPQNPSDETPSDPKEFSLAGGGTLFIGELRGAPAAVGLWPRYDLFWKDARFKPQKTRVDIEVVRVKL